jgi:DDE superfamily endonuclease
MLPRQTVPASLAALLAVFRPLLTAPSYRTFCALTCGLIAAGGRRTVCGMLTGAGLASRWHHSRAHHLFAYARWSPDALGLALAGLLVARLVPAEAPIRLVVDDTLFHRRGRRVHAAYWTHDGSAPGGRKIGYGNRWIICCLLVQLPFLTRPVALPVLFRLWDGKGGTTPVQLAVGLVQAIADRFGDRRIDVVADGAYFSAALRALPAQVSWTLRLRRNARLNGLTPPRTGRPGRPRLRGDRLGTPAELAERATFTPVEVFRYGQREQVHLACVTCQWYQPFHTRPCRVVLLREQHTATGYDLALISTDLTSIPAALVSRYAARWAIEVAIFDAKQTTGVGQARNRLRPAVERTAPFALMVQSLVVLWYVDHGEPAADLHAARLAAPWYTTKTEPCYADMHAALRKTIIATRFSPTTPAAASDLEIHAVLAAWAAAEPTAAA